MERRTEYWVGIEGMMPLCIAQRYVNRCLRLDVADAVPSGLNASASKATAADLNLKNTSAGDGESRSKIEETRDGGIY